MELELQSPLSLAPHAFNVLISPEEVLIASLNGQASLQRVQVLYVSGNSSRILDKLNRRFTELDVRRAFTAHQLLTILKEAYQTLIIFEHDPSSLRTEPNRRVRRPGSEGARGSQAWPY